MNSMNSLLYRTFVALALLSAFSCSCSVPDTPAEDSGDTGGIKPKPEPEPLPDGPSAYNTLDGLVMCGYQGWFNTPDDGAGLKWKHYEKNGKFEPGCCSIDLWPEVDEYLHRYETAFRYEDGTPAYVFSSRDVTTVRTHFKWMKQYNIDGVFVQRFVTTVKSSSKRDNCTEILMNCVSMAETYGRAVCVMYDLSGMKPGDSRIVKEDWKMLTEQKNITAREKNHYLYHNGRPLVAVWGVGFSDDGREYTLEECAELVDFFKENGCSVMLGVPAKWRTLASDAVSDPALHTLIKKCDVVHPWFVGRYSNDSFSGYKSLIKDDIAWCKSNSLTYIPTVFPGFSWYNMKDGGSELNKIPRLAGRFLWNQINTDITLGARTLYFAMFDEIDEGTAIFKCANRVPSGASPFVTYEGVPSDRYMWLAGQARKILKGEMTNTATMPSQPK